MNIQGFCYIMWFNLLIVSRCVYRESQQVVLWRTKPFKLSDLGRYWLNLILLYSDSTASLLGNTCSATACVIVCGAIRKPRCYFGRVGARVPEENPRLLGESMDKPFFPKTVFKPRRTTKATFVGFGHFLITVCATLLFLLF